MQAIVVGVFALLCGAGFCGYLLSRKEALIKKRDAEIVVAHQSQHMALAVAEAIRTDLETTEERTERRTLSGRVQGLETHIRSWNR